MDPCVKIPENGGKNPRKCGRYKNPRKLPQITKIPEKYFRGFLPLVSLILKQKCGYLQFRSVGGVEDKLSENRS